ncbi:MAG: hypothetical protein R3F17_01260 [Planctomycetota bacterium]
MVPLVAQAMTSLNPDLCSADSVDEIYGDLARTMYRRSGVRSQDDYELHDMLTQSFGQEEADRVLKDIATRRRQNQPPLPRIRSTRDRGPRASTPSPPPVVSLVLAHVSPSVSAAVLNTFDEERALDVLLHDFDRLGIETYALHRRQPARLHPPGREHARAA